MISHVTIKSVPNDARFIAEVLGNLEYFDASKICVFPSFENNCLKFTAYVEVREWCDCNSAYNAIRAMKDDGMVRIGAIIPGRAQWIMKKTAAADLWYTETDNKWTTAFAKEVAPDYAEYELDSETMNAVYQAPELDFSAFHLVLNM